MATEIVFDVSTGERAEVDVPDVKDSPRYPTAAAAVAAVVSWAEAFVAPLVSGAPAEERLSWPIKEAAAVAYKNGAPDPAQAALIDGEAAVTGEDPFALAEVILAKAEVYRTAVAAIAGLRRKVTADIELVQDPYQYEEILAAAQAEAVQLASDLGLAEALGVA